MSRKIKITLTLFIVAIGAIPLFVRLNPSRHLSIVGFLLIVFALSLLAYYTLRGQAMGVLILSCVFILGVYTAYQTNVLPGTLLSYDQHITARFIEETTHTGQIDRLNDPFRGARKGRYIPGMYLFGSTISVVTGLDAISTVKVLPLAILVSLPFTGAVLLDSYRKYAALLWIEPLFYVPPTGVAKAQLFALPLLGILYFAIIRPEGRNRIYLVALSGFTLIISHTLTPVLGLVFITGYTILAKPRSRKGSVAFLLILVLWIAWIAFIENELILIPSAYLATLNLQAYFSGLNPVAAREPFPRPTGWWIGHVFRASFFGLLGGIFVTIIGYKLFLKQSLAENPFRHHAIVLLSLAGIFGFGFPLIFDASGILRGWIFVTLFSAPAVGYVLLQADFSIRSNVVHTGAIIFIVLCATGFAILTTAFRGIFRGAEFPTLVVIGSTLFVGMVLIMAVATHPGKQIGFRTPFSSSAEKLIMVGLVILLIGTAGIGVPPSVFSEQHRVDSRVSPGLPMYHTAEEYAVSGFASSYADGAVSGDRRVFILEEYFRHQYVENPACYRSASCPTQYIIWMNTYEKMWQGADTIIVPHTFPNGEQYLDTYRSKIFTTGNSSIYTNESQ